MAVLVSFMIEVFPTVKPDGNVADWLPVGAFQLRGTTLLYPECQPCPKPQVSIGCTTATLKSFAPRFG